MITTTRDYLGHIWQLDKGFVEKTEKHLNEREEARHYFIDKFLSTRNEEAYNVARFIEYEITGIRAYLGVVFDLELYQDENRKYKIKPREH